MKLQKPLLGTVFLLLFACQTLHAQSADEVDPEAVKSAEAFLQLLDEGQWAQAYESGIFTMSASLFERLIPKHRTLRGKFLSRSFVAGESKGKIIVGDEEVQRLELEFSSLFENNPATEMVGVIKGGAGPWRVHGYSMK